MQQFIDSLHDKKIIVFGTGSASVAVMERLDVEISYFIDNDPCKWNLYFIGKPVNSPFTLSKEEKGQFVVLIASMFHEEISSQLNDMGYEADIDYFNALDLFINPFGYEEDVAIYEEERTIDNKIRSLIKRGWFNDARQLLSDYKKIAPFDERITNYAKLIMLNDRRYKELEKVLHQEIDKSKSNLGYNTIFNSAVKLERHGKYLDAIETYEKLLMKASESSLKEELASRIVLLENDRKKEILEQLKVREYRINQYGSYNLHIMYDCMHSKSFIDFVDEYFDINEHYFIVFYWGDDTVFVDRSYNKNVLIIRVQEEDYEILAMQVQRLFSECRQVFIHYLHDFFCWLMLKCDTRGVMINWRLWGGDNYPEFSQYDSETSAFLDRINFLHTNISKCRNIEDKIREIYRRAAIRRMSRIIVGIKGEYDDTLNKFITTAEYIEAYNPLLIDFQMFDKAEAKQIRGLKEKYRSVILLGNSGDPSNNHLEVLLILREFGNEDFCVVVPLSYGNQLYINSLIIEGKKILGDRFIPITEFMGQQEYSELISTVDVAVMNHNRSQAMGNILGLLYLRKKIYAKSTVNTIKTLESYGVNLYNNFYSPEMTFDSLIKSDEEIGVANRNIVIKKFNKAELVEKYRQIFNVEEA